MAVHSLYFFASNLVKYQGKLTCDFKWTEAFGEYFSSKNYFLAVIIVFIYTPIVLLIILYSIILINLKIHLHPGEHSTNSEEQRSRRNRKLKMAIANVLVFGVCRLPFTITTVIIFFAWDTVSIPCDIQRLHFFCQVYGLCKLCYQSNLVKYQGKLTCDFKWTEAFGEYFSSKNYFLAVIIVFIYTPIVLLIILYSIILINLKIHLHPGEHSTNSEEQRSRRNRKLKMAIANVLVFGVCRLPFTITTVTIFFAWDTVSIPCDIQRLHFFARFIAYANCAINPVICLIFSSNYRQGLKRLLNCFGAVQQ